MTQTEIRDAIEQQVLIAAPAATVWDMVTTPDAMQQWYGRPTGPLKPGADLTLVFEHADGSVDRSPAHVEVVEPPQRLVFQWRPGPCQHWDDTLGADAPLEAGPRTTVEITLRPTADGTLVCVRESGFSTLDPVDAPAVLAANEAGWSSCLDALQGLASGASQA